MSQTIKPMGGAIGGALSTGSIAIYSEGTLISPNVSVMNFVGNGVSITAANGVATVTISQSTQSWLWDSSYIGSGLTLSLGNTRVTASNPVFGSVLGDRNISGRKVFRAILTQDPGAGDVQFGIGTRAITLTNSQIGSSPQGFVYSKSGNKVNNATGSAFGPSYTTSDAVDVAVDTLAGAVWFGKNGTFQGNPVAGTGAAFTFTPGAYTFYPGAYIDGNSVGGSWTITPYPSTLTGFTAL